VQPEPVRPEPARAADLTLRPACDSDLDFVLDLCRKVFQKYGSYDRYLAEWFRKPFVSTWIADLESVPAGFFMLAIHPPPGEGAVSPSEGRPGARARSERASRDERVPKREALPLSAASLSSGGQPPERSPQRKAAGVALEGVGRKRTEMVAELLSIAVVPELRSLGIGSALLDRAIAVAFDAGPEIREIRLSVAEGNARAQRMFARRGFRIGPAVGLYPAGQRALFMSKTRKAP
jgi:ribosomal protein S18 acetylase RimI-like enzyme